MGAPSSEDRARQDPDPTVGAVGATGLGAGLDPLQREILEFERSWWATGAPKGRAVRERFGLTSTRYHQLLMQTLDLSPALAFDPPLVLRLRRLREARRRARLAERLGLGWRPG